MQIKNQTKMIDAIEFFKWCNTPIYRARENSLYVLRVIPQFPEYDSYLVIDETGEPVFPRGVFLSAEEVYEYWDSYHKKNK